MAKAMIINYYLGESDELIESQITPREDAKVGDVIETFAPNEKFRVVSFTHDGIEQNCVCEKVS